MLAALFHLASSTLATGCVGARLEMGRRVDPAQLETALRIGESTRADVLRALGEPHGRRRGLLPIGAIPKIVWSYFDENGVIENNKPKEARLMFLWVDLDGDRYDGYMWFSSLGK
jgi:hypothetical protein